MRRPKDLDRTAILKIYLHVAEGELSGRWIEVDTFAGADAFLMKVYHRAPKNGGYDKVDFVLWGTALAEVLGEDVYEGRIDVDGDHYPDLKAHVRSFLRYVADEAPDYLFSKTDDETGPSRRDLARRLLEIIDTLY